ncbi:MAG: hypothetical protein MZW92_08945 [Comamonadaceae bacterium]|nr:hypothetical protein [Comamonadaceae bacterium]
MEKSLAEGSQTFEQDLARLINEGVDLARRRPGLRRLADQPAVAAAERAGADVAPARRKKDEPEPATFTEITLDVRADEPRAA